MQRQLAWIDSVLTVNTATWMMLMGHHYMVTTPHWNSARPWPLRGRNSAPPHPYWDVYEAEADAAEAARPIYLILASNISLNIGIK